jgi:hypothetical protein
MVVRRIDVLIAATTGLHRLAVAAQRHVKAEGGSRRVPGWLVTVVAVLMGAPFWFDAVGRLTNLRATGKPPTSRALGET